MSSNILITRTNLQNIESMDKKKQITELIKEDNWYDIPVENTVDKIFSILGVVRQSEQIVCKITNDKFSWVLEVDGKIITFNGSDNAEYFAELYAKLGYNVEWGADK